MTSRSMLVVVGALSLLGLVGCALSTGSGRAAEDARDSLYALFDDTQAALGGKWENQDDPTSRGCVIPIWVDGIRYPGLRVGPPADDVDAAITEITRLWDQLHYRVETTTSTDVVELTATSPNGEIAILRLSEDAMTLHGESECRPAG